MRFTLSSTALSSCLNTLSRVINSKNSLPILDCFLFKVNDGLLSITASDSENTIQSTLKLDSAEGNGDFAISSRTVLDAVKELPEQPLNFDIDTDTFSVQVSYQNGLYHFTAQSAEEYPRTQLLNDNTTTITIDAGILVDNLTRSLFATAEDELRPVMNGVYFDLTPESLNIVASDGHKLVRNKFFGIKSDAPTSFILPKKPSTLLKNILNRDGGDVIIRFNDRNSEIKFDNSILNCRLIEGRYPNYNSVIPEDNPNKLTIDRKSLLSALRHVVPFASESSELVRFQLGQGKLELNSEDLDFATSAKEQLPCDYSGQEMSIGFKGTSLQEILTNLESDEIIMELADPSRAGIVYPVTQPDNGEVLMLLMPMLLND